MQRLSAIGFITTLSTLWPATSSGEPWTVFITSPDTQIVFVSAAGSDASGHPYVPGDPAFGADPFHPASEVQAYRTLAAAKAQMRNAKPDWMLLRRGDTWHEALGNWSKSGKSATAPILIGAYGNGAARPRLLTGNSGAFQTFNNQATPVNYLALAGLAMEADARNPDVAGPVGVQVLAPTNGFRIE